jgi:hypothetical protein
MYHFLRRDQLGGVGNVRRLLDKRFEKVSGNTCSAARWRVVPEDGRVLKEPVGITIDTSDNEWRPSLLALQNTLKEVLRSRARRDRVDLQQIGTIQVRSDQVRGSWIHLRVVEG